MRGSIGLGKKIGVPCIGCAKGLSRFRGGKSLEKKKKADKGRKARKELSVCLGRWVESRGIFKAGPRGKTIGHHRISTEGWGNARANAVLIMTGRSSGKSS